MFDKDEFEILKAALVHYNCSIKMNCIYCDDSIKLPESPCGDFCDTYKILTEIKKLKTKIENQLQ